MVKLVSAFVEKKEAAKVACRALVELNKKEGQSMVHMGLFFPISNGILITRKIQDQTSYLFIQVRGKVFQ